MRVVIAGTRTIDDYGIVLQAIRACPWQQYITEVVCGESENEVRRYLAGRRKGNPDIFGAVWAMRNGIPFVCFPASWDTYGKAAGPIRNGEMADYGDGLILVWTGNPEKSKGSANMLEQAMRAGYPREHIFQRIITEEQLHAAQATRTQSRTT